MTMKRLISFALVALLALGGYAIQPAQSAGTVFGLPLSLQWDAEINPVRGGKLYVYKSGGTGDADLIPLFQDYSLAAPASNPLTLDAAGRIPQFWVDETDPNHLGNVRVRLLTDGGIPVFDADYIQVLGPAGGGGGGGGVAQGQAFQSGDLYFALNANGNDAANKQTRTGWVRANGKTIGRDGSGATERANDDTELLYAYVWNNCDDTQCPVGGNGRGLDYLEDWNNGDPIQIYDLRGRTIAGTDDMGSPGGGIIGSEVIGDIGGAANVTLTVPQLPAHDHSAVVTDPGHSHDVDPPNTGTTSAGNHNHGNTGNNSHSHTHTTTTWNPGTLNVQAGSGNFPARNATKSTASGNQSANHFHSTGSTGTHSHTVNIDDFDSDDEVTGIDVTIGATGSGDPVDVTQPFILGTWYLKL